MGDVILRSSSSNTDAVRGRPVLIRVFGLDYCCQHLILVRSRYRSLFLGTCVVRGINRRGGGGRRSRPARVPAPSEARFMPPEARFIPRHTPRWRRIVSGCHIHPEHRQGPNRRWNVATPRRVACWAADPRSCWRVGRSHRRGLPAGRGAASRPGPSSLGRSARVHVRHDFAPRRQRSQRQHRPARGGREPDDLRAGEAIAVRRMPVDVQADVRQATYARSSRAG
jgi:hypothetical protein